jgi:hypothetical protein
MMRSASPVSPKRGRAARAPVILCLAAFAACGGGSGEEATPSATPPPPTAADVTMTPTPPPPDSPYRLVYRESGGEQDTIWRVLPADPAQREQLAVIPHRAGFSIIASISPDGRLLAYLALPEAATSVNSSQAEAHLLDLQEAEGRQPKLIVSGVDYRYRPLWSSDSRLLFLRRYAGPEPLAADVSVLQVTIPPLPPPGEPTPKATPTPAAGAPPPEDPVRTILQAKVSQVLAFTPVGFSEDRKSLYFVQVEGGTRGGTLLGAYRPASPEAIATATAEAGATVTAVVDATATAASGVGATVPPEPPELPPSTPTPATKFIVMLSEQIAQEFDLSSDTHKLAFSAQGLVEGAFVNQAFVADLVTSAVQPLNPEGLPAGGQMRPLWHPDSQRVAVGIARPGGEVSPIALVTAAGGPAVFLAPPDSGFDVPLLWSPDGVFLAVTNRRGADPTVNPEGYRLDIVAPTGQRMSIAEGTANSLEDSVVGWVKVQ